MSSTLMALIADPDRDSARLITSCLKEIGIGVSEVTGAVEAVITARQTQPSIVFIAVQLKDATGSELAGWLRTNPLLSAIPIVAMHASDEAPADYKGFKFEANLKKPLTRTKIRHVLATLGLIDAPSSAAPEPSGSRA